MARRLFPPNVQFFNTDGTVLAGGFIYTYITGTTTAKDSYTTQAAGTTNDNPLTLDAYGRIDNSSKNMWLAEDVAYRIVVKDADGITLSTTDNVEGILDSASNLRFQNGYGILDANGNEALFFVAASSAVNYAVVTSAATGDGPIYGVAGDDTDISVNVTPKGAGTILLNGPVTASGAVTLSSTVAITGALTLSNNVKVSNGYGVLDSNGNEELIFGVTSSAVNNHKITNAATGSGPTLAVEGGDTNIDSNFQAKGTGVYNFKATSDQGATIRLFEDTDNGTNYVGWKAPASVATSYDAILPTAIPGSGTEYLTIDSTGQMDTTSAITGVILQYVYDEITTAASTTAVIPWDTTIPQVTEGTQYTSLAITPTSASSSLRIRFHAWMSSVGSQAGTVALFESGTADALMATDVTTASGGQQVSAILETVIANSATDERTFTIRYGSETGTTLCINRNGPYGAKYSTSSFAFFEILELDLS